MAGHRDPLRSTLTLSAEEIAGLESLDREDRPLPRAHGQPRSYGPGGGENITDV